MDISPDAVYVRDTGSTQELLSLAPAFFRRGPAFPLPSIRLPPPHRGPLIPSRLCRRKEKARGRRGPDASTMSARNIAGHHTGARFAMIPRVINNVCFNVNLRLGSNLISTEATRSNADGDWLGEIARSYGARTLENGGRDERSSREEEVEEEKEEGTAEKWRRRRREEEEEDEQEGPLGIVRGRSLVTRDSCDPDDP